MIIFRVQLILVACILCGSYVASAATAMSKAQKAQQASQIESLRKSSATIIVVDSTAPVSGQELHLQQIRHHFGFGAAIS